MTRDNLTLPPQFEETVEMMELHRQMMLANGFQFAPEEDNFSLAQPSPYRFVPMVASNGAAALDQGE